MERHTATMFRSVQRFLVHCVIGPLLMWSEVVLLLDTVDDPLGFRRLLLHPPERVPS